MSFEEVRVGLLEESKEIGNIGGSYAAAADCYDEAHEDLGAASTELDTAVANVYAVGGLVMQAVEGMKHVYGDMTRARYRVGNAATASITAQGMTVGYCHELEGPAGRVLQRIATTSDPMAQDLITSISSIGHRAAVEEAGPTAKATGAAAEAINPDGPRLARLAELLAAVEAELMGLKQEIDDDNDIVRTTRSIVADAKLSTLDSQSAVLGLSTEVAEVAYGL